MRALGQPQLRRQPRGAEPIEVEPHPLLTWAHELAKGIVREDGRARLSDELYPDVVSEILVARLEHKDPVARATARRRLAKRTVEAHVARHGWRCPGWHRERRAAEFRHSGRAGP